jgi:hypothetical protein
MDENLNLAITFKCVLIIESTLESHFYKSVAPVLQPGVVIVSNKLALAIKIGVIEG